MNVEDEILAQMIAAPETAKGLDDLADKMVDYAKSIAPVFGEGPPTKRGEPPMGGYPGEYRDSIHVAKVPGKPHIRRVISEDDPQALWIEIGTSHMPEYAVFAKTAAEFGGTGPVLEEGVQQAQGKLHGALETLKDLAAQGAEAGVIAGQTERVRQARIARSAAFNAARPRRGRR